MGMPSNHQMETWAISKSEWHLRIYMKVTQKNQEIEKQLESAKQEY